MNSAASDKLAIKAPPAKLCHTSLATGLMLAGIAVAATRIDVLNNYDYGVQISHELAGVMVLAAIGVTALPAAAALRGWDWLLRQTRDRGGCGANCRKAEEALSAVLARMPAAGARNAAIARIHAAERRLDNARGEAKTGPAEASMLAGYIARQSGRDAAEIARTIALATTAFAIVVTLLMAGLAHRAVDLITQGLGVPLKAAAKTARPEVGQAALAKQTAQVEGAEAPAPKLPSTDRSSTLSIPPEQRILAFARSTFRAGVELTGAEVYELFAAWWRAHCPGELIPSQTFLSAALVEAGVNREKRGGKIRYSPASEATD